MPTENLLIVKQLSKSYGERLALSDVNLSLRRGEIHGLIGPNGAGKTTLSACIAGEITATSGSITYRDRDITRLSELTVGVNMEIARAGAQLRPFRALLGRTWHSNEDELHEVGLMDRRDVLASELAQADRKRLELAMVLAMRPQLVVLDEPTAGMSAQEADGCAELLARLAVERDLTMLITEHNMSVMFRLANVITVLDEGQVMMTETPENVRGDERLTRTYFGEQVL